MRGKSSNSQNSKESHPKPEGERSKGPVSLRAQRSNRMSFAKLVKISQAQKGNLIAVRNRLFFLIYVFFFLLVTLRKKLTSSFVT